jgi:hypothetical protein
VGLSGRRQEPRHTMRKLGPRILVKRDEESSVGRGAMLYGAHFRPEMAIIVWAAARSAPTRAHELHITEGYRSIRDARDLHEELRALDITFRLPHNMLPTKEEYDAIGQRMRLLLGPDHDVIVHGADSNRHVHCELDPK